MVKHAGINSLPNELLVQVFMSFPTRTLLPLASVSHRFHDIILRILHRRLHAAAALQEHKLILECFHPSARLNTPGLFCHYIGTDGLGNCVDCETDPYKDVQQAGRLGKLAGLYSRFRPVGPKDERRPPRRRHPAGDVPGYPNVSAMFPTSPSDEAKIPSQIVSFESYQLFSQRCTIAYLVKSVPNVRFLINCVKIGEGVIRIWRNWLAERAVLPGSGRLSQFGSSSRSAPLRATDLEGAEQMLWLDETRNVGIRLRVIEREDFGTPILTRLDESSYVSYSIEFEELVIRTTQLLLKVEESLLQETDEMSKVIIIGS